MCCERGFRKFDVLRILKHNHNHSRSELNIMKYFTKPIVHLINTESDEGRMGIEDQRYRRSLAQIEKCFSFETSSISTGGRGGFFHERDCAI